MCVSVSFSLLSTQRLFVLIWYSKRISLNSFDVVVYSICMHRQGTSKKTASIWTDVARDSIVSIGACYGLGIESRWGRNFSAPVQTSLGPHPGPSLSRGQIGQGVALTTHPYYSAKVKERVELYLYSPCGPS